MTFFYTYSSFWLECLNEGFVEPRNEKGYPPNDTRRDDARRWGNEIGCKHRGFYVAVGKKKKKQRTRGRGHHVDYKFYRGLHDFLFSLHHSSRGRATEHVNNQKRPLFLLLFQSQQKSRIRRPTTSQKGRRPSISLERGKRDLLLFWLLAKFAGCDIISYKKRTTKQQKKIIIQRLKIGCFDFPSFYSKMVTQIFWLKSNEEDSCARRL